MADETVVHIGENSPEEVAYKLMLDIGRAEGKKFGLSASPANTDRKWILDTYAECLRIILHPGALRDLTEMAG